MACYEFEIWSFGGKSQIEKSRAPYRIRSIDQYLALPCEIQMGSSLGIGQLGIEKLGIESKYETIHNVQHNFDSKEKWRSMAEDRAAVQVSTRRFILASSDSESSDVEGKSEQR